MSKIRCCAARDHPSGITRVPGLRSVASFLGRPRPDRPMLPIAGWAVECATRTVCAEPSIRTTRTRRQNVVGWVERNVRPTRRGEMRRLVGVATPAALISISRMPSDPTFTARLPRRLSDLGQTQPLGPRDIPADESGFFQWPIGSDPAGNERTRQPHVPLSRHVTSKEVAVRSRSTINASAICRSSACPSLTPPVASICTPRLKVMMSATTPMAGNRSGSTS
jgi:hypothetical protein